MVNKPVDLILTFIPIEIRQTPHAKRLNLVDTKMLHETFNRLYN